MFARIWRRNGQTPSKRGVELPSTDTVKGGPAQRLSDLRRQLENAKEDERASLLETQRAALNTKTNYLLARVDETAEGRNGQEVFGYIDDAIRVSNAGIFVVGWLAHAKGAIRKMSVANSAGRQVEASYSPTPMSRADVTNEIRPTSFVMHDDDHGFAIYFTVDDLNERETQWRLVIDFEFGDKRQIPFMLGVSPEPLDGIKRALSKISGLRTDLGSAFANTVGPCLESIWAQKRANEVREDVLTVGDTVPKPKVSVIVPLYRRIDFIRFQVANFSNDPDFVGESAIAELIYVLDDPPLETELRALCRLVHLTYKISLRIVILSRNTGYSHANNAGARIARGDYLLLLNSDVLPKRTGWLSDLVGTYRDIPDCGALGCRLLFEDGSIQHAGMAFVQCDDLVHGTWLNAHRFKGYPANFDTAKGTVEVPAVTGACLLVKKSLYDKIGGLDEGYVVGDYEDSDFCLKLRERGFMSWYTPDVELYHLERQSIDANPALYKGTSLITLYNMWKHAKRWGSTIGGLSNRTKTLETTFSEESK